jgi:hypothetical protein
VGGGGYWRFMYCEKEVVPRLVELCVFNSIMCVVLCERGSLLEQVRERAIAERGTFSLWVSS